MERILARALKPSLRRELLVKQTSNVTCDDFFSEAEISGAPNEDFPVEELFDFSNGNFADEFVAEEDDSVSSHENYINSNCGTLSGIGDFASLSTTELTFPADDLENLEWLSQFVDDSGPELSILYPAGEEKAGIGFQPVQSPVSPRPPFFPTSFPAKTRSKRSRLVGRVWSLDPQALSESSSSPPSSSSTVSSLSSRPVTPARIVAMFDEKPSAKKQKKNSPAPFQRRCSHCQVQKTPQWRTGPLGPKTLCNACGVRYKSGRLFPEYRPACSPTFRDEFYSNSHRKVLEMRRQKDESDSKMSWLG